MSARMESYENLDYSLPSKSWAWNMYGAGLENNGRDGKPELFPVPEPNDDQLLVRVDAVGLCFSDVKLINQGGEHAKLYHRNLAVEPTRLGHEAAFTVVKVGKNLQNMYKVGQKLAIQPDIYQNQRATAYGYTIPGGLVQYHLVGDEVLKADAGSYLLPVSDEMSYAEAALTEPWACVEAAYTQRRRLDPKPGGTMLIVGSPDDRRPYTFSSSLKAPSRIIVCNISADMKLQVQNQKRPEAELFEETCEDLNDFQRLDEKYADGKGFDDTVLLGITSAALVTEAAKHIAFRGSLNMVSDKKLDGLCTIDSSRIHYHYTTYIGNASTDISASYGEARNRSELMDGGTLVVVGGAGPMGQMHVQRSLEMLPGPKRVIVTDLNQKRLDALKISGDPIAARNGKEFILVNTTDPQTDLVGLVRDLTGGEMAEDVVVCVPVGKVMQDAAALLGKDGMLNFFAGTAPGTFINVDLSNIFLNNMQLTGTSGSTLFDQETVIRKATEKKLSPNLSVAAIGGLNSAIEGMDAMIKGTYTGKIVIFPQLPDLPLMGLSELAEKDPEIAAKLGENETWSREAEQAIIEKYWKLEA